MVGREGVLLVAEDLLIEFLARTQTGVGDVDVLVRYEACKFDHSPRKACNLDTFAHVKDEDLIACGHRCCFHHKAAGFRNGHEETGYVRMCDRHRAAFCNLLAEARDDRAVGAEDIAKAGGDELGLALSFSFFDCKSERLDIDFRKALGTAHDIGRIDCLVGRNHDHLFHIILYAFVSNVPAASDIHQDCFTWVLFHQRDVLVGCCMKDNLRMESAEDIVQSCRDPHVTDYRMELQLRVGLFEFKAEIVHRCLCIVKKDELPDSKRCKLAT